MDDIPSISSGVVGSRFVSQNEIDTAKARRDEQWKAAYARLGQQPPPQPTDDVYDGRSLAEKLAANKAAKQEEWEERNKLANQFRALEEDEVMFLDSLRDEQHRKELKRKQEDAADVKVFKQAVAARNESKPVLPSTTPSTSTAVAPPTAPVKKTAITTGPKKPPNKTLKGVIVKKKKDPAPKPPESTSKEPSDSKEGSSKRQKI